MPSDLLTLARERAHANLFWRYLDVQVDDAGEGWVRLRVPVRVHLMDGNAGEPARESDLPEQPDAPARADGQHDGDAGGEEWTIEVGLRRNQRLCTHARSVCKNEPPADAG